jgi:hypothetical protein
MPNIRYTTLAATLVLVAGHVQATELMSIEWTPAGVFKRELTVPAGKFAEVCGKVPAKSAVAWNFDADAPLDFNIHYHQGKKVEYPAKLAEVSKGSDTLKTDTEQDYCWMWSNKTGKDARLMLSLQRQ